MLLIAAYGSLGCARDTARDTPQPTAFVVDKSFRDFRVAVAHAGSIDAGSDGVRIRDGEVVEWLGLPVRGEIYFLVSGDERVPGGDLCASYDLACVESCEEPTGTFHIVGAKDLTVTFDGDVACDARAALTVDGVDAGEVCVGS